MMDTETRASLLDIANKISTRRASWAEFTDADFAAIEVALRSVIRDADKARRDATARQRAADRIRQAALLERQP